jgi:hypothetical protein
VKYFAWSAEKDISAVPHLRRRIYPQCITLLFVWSAEKDISAVPFIPAGKDIPAVKYFAWSAEKDISAVPHLRRRIYPQHHSCLWFV